MTYNYIYNINIIKLLNILIKINANISINDY